MGRYSDVEQDRNRNTKIRQFNQWFDVLGLIDDVITSDVIIYSGDEDSGTEGDGEKRCSGGVPAPKPVSKKV